jgi:hypothetical protein
MAADTFPNCGFDRATGTNGFLGTPTPDASLVVVTPDGTSPNAFIFEEESGSPDIERAEQGTFQHNWKVDQDTGITLIGAISRGYEQEDSSGNSYRVLSARLVQQPGNQSRFQTTSESLTFDIPPDEFGVEVVEFNPDLCRHPLFLPVTTYNGTSTGGQPVTGTMIVSLCKNAATQPQLQVMQDSFGAINSSLITDSTVLTLAIALAQKYQQGEDTFYLAGFKVSYSVYNRFPPLLNPGSYIEDPVDSGVLPAFFWSDNQTVTGNNIFTFLASELAPDYYSNGFSTLRLSDTVVYQRTWFKQTASWIMAPYGHWDTDIYSGG